MKNIVEHDLHPEYSTDDPPTLDTALQLTEVLIERFSIPWEQAEYIAALMVESHKEASSAEIPGYGAIVQYCEGCGMGWRKAAEIGRFRRDAAVFSLIDAPPIMECPGVRVDISTPIAKAIEAYLEVRPDWDYQRFINAALSLYLLQSGDFHKSPDYRDIAQIYIDSLFGGDHEATS